MSKWSVLRERLMRNPLFRFLLRYEELIRYGIIGVLTTAVNITVYALCTRVFFRSLFQSNSALYAIVFNYIGWGFAVLFAFFANRAFVFNSRDHGKTLFAQFLSFVALRVGSSFVENLVPSLLISRAGMHDLIAKVLVSFVVILLNYIFTKFVTFARRKPKTALTPAGLLSDSAASAETTQNDPDSSKENESLPPS